MALITGMLSASNKPIIVMNLFGVEYFSFQILVKWVSDMILLTLIG